MRNADAAMYRAKSEGRDAYRFYSADMTEQAIARVAMETALRKALSEDQFVLHYQPQFDIRSERLMGCEALVRWSYPEQGLLPPNRFIPIAEGVGCEEQANFLIAQGCNEAQGFLYGQPVPSGEFAVFCERQRQTERGLVG